MALAPVGSGGSAWAEETAQGRAGDDSGSGEVHKPSSAPLALGVEAVRPSARALELKRGVPLLTYADAAARPTHTSLLPVGVRGRKIPVQTVEVDSGRVDVELPTAGYLGILLRGPDGLSVIATQGRVSMVVEDSKTHVITFGHDVLVGKEGRFDSVKAGFVVRYDRQSGASSTPETLPKAPQLRASAAVAPYLGGPTRVAILAPGNTQELRFSIFDEQGKQVGATTRAPSKTSFLVTLPRPGTYRVVARALDESGVGGPVSVPETVRILGMEGGLRWERGAYLLTPEQKVPLLGAQGLEMYHESLGGFVPAPERIGLIDAKKTNLFFRDPANEARTVSLRLEPLVAQARVSLSPGMALWPQHPIKMSVLARDLQGEPMVVGDNFDVKVRVNFDEVEVDWQPQEGGVQATLAPQKGAGPWVVRVSVLDEYGTEVGRGHLEVISGQSLIRPVASR